MFWFFDWVLYLGKIVDYDFVEFRYCVEYVEDGVKEFLLLWKEDVILLLGERFGLIFLEVDEVGVDLLLGFMVRG